MPDYTLANVLSSAGVKAKPLHTKVKITGHKPRKSQLKVLKAALMNMRFGDYSDPGTGKSLTSYLYISAVTMAGRKVMALMPPGLTEQYVEKLYESVDFEATGKTVHILNQTPKDREKLFKLWNRTKWPDVLVIGYQMFLKEGAKSLRGKGYDCFVADEAHMLKSASSKTHKLFKLFLKEARNPRTLYMTGTPSPTTPECAHGLISLTTPEIYRSKASFDRKHLVKVTMGNFKTVVGFKNLEFLSENLYKKALRVLKEEVLDLKTPNVIPVDVKMSLSHKKLYRELLDERILEIGGEVIPVIQSQTLRRYAMQIASDPNSYTDTKIANNTMPRLLAILDSIGVVKFNKSQSLCKENQLTKVVIFAHYKQTITMLEECLQHLNPAVISGKTNTESNKKKFIEDETCRAVIIQPQSGGAGLDGMQNVCHNVVFFEPVTSPGIFDQCASRLIRSGQLKVVNVYVFNVLGTVYARAIRVMLGRAGDMKNVVIKVGDFINELLGKL